MTAPPSPDGLVLFDCDGVLVDSERLSITIDQQVLAELGWDLTLDEIVHRFVGRSQAEYEREVEQHLGRRLPEGWEESNAWRYREAFVSSLRPVPGIEGALDAITWSTCVASSGTHDRMRFTLGLTGPLGSLRGTHLQRDGGRARQAGSRPLPARRQGHGLGSGRCVVVEDSVHGVTAALTAGMAVVGYAGGVTPRDRLEGPGVVVIDDMRDLPSAIARASASA